MSEETIACSFIPLVDAAPLIVAREMGFDQGEGIRIELRKERSWSALRDRVLSGGAAAAHMLTPLPIAMNLGLGGAASRMHVLSILSMNGDVIGAAPRLAAMIREGGPPLDINDAHAVGARLAKTAKLPLRIGVPFPFSMHLELLDYWLSAIGIRPDDRSIHIVPPPLMPVAVKAGEIDLFCVGEPWGSAAVEARAAEIILAGSAIWRFAPEKALAVSDATMKERPDAAARLLRATWRAGRWLSEDANRLTASEFLSWPHYLGVEPDIIERAFSGRITVAPEGYEARVNDFIAFFDRAATFPWRSQAIWIARRLAARHDLPLRAADDAARASFRADFYRQSLAETNADLPGASEKIEGFLNELTPVSSSKGQTFLGPDNFFDGEIFDFST